MNIVCTIYKRVKKLENENKLANISSILGMKNRPTLDNLIIMNAVTEK